MTALATCCLLSLTLHAPPLAVQGAHEDLDARDWREIRSLYDRSRHAMVAVGGTHQAHNPGQRWGLAFDGRGFQVEPSGGAWSWGLELSSYGLEGYEESVALPTDACAEGGHLTYVWGPDLEEWYHNDARGLEHGFTVHERPAGDELSGLSFSLDVRGDLRPGVTDGGRGVEFVDARGTVQVTYSGLTVLDADGRELSAAFQASERQLHLSVADRGARYPITIDPLALQAYLKASNTEAHDNFGSAVAVWGDTVAIGAPREDSAATGVNGNQGSNAALDSGAVYVFTRSGGSWSQEAYLKASNPQPFDVFGSGLALHGDTLVVGAVQEDSGSTTDQSDNSVDGAGAVYVFRRQGGAWSQEAYLKASHPDPDDWFGATVAVSGSTIAVGARLEDSNALGVNGDETDDSTDDVGAVYVFTRRAGVWTQQAYLKPHYSEPRYYFGISLALDGDTLVVGAHAERGSATGVNGDPTATGVDRAGAAYVFVRDGNTWSQQAYLKASNTDPRDRFGGTVAVSGDTIAVGATGEDSGSSGVGGNQGNEVHYPEFDAGAAYVFQRSGTTWSQEAYIKSFDARHTENFGRVSLVGDTLAVGCFGVTGYYSSVDGPVYVYRRDQGVWSEDISLYNPNGYDDAYGSTAAMAGSTFVMGAAGDDSSATGVNGDGSDDGALFSGAAYVYQFPDPSEVCTSLPNATGSAAVMHCAGLPGSSLVLFSEPVPNTVGQFFYGPMMLAGSPFGDGTLCVGGMTRRIHPFITAGMMMQSPNRAVLSVNYTAPYASGLTGTQYFQHWFRSGLATGSGFNTSSSLAVTF